MTRKNDTTCSECGQWLIRKARFCHHCGHDTQTKQFNSVVVGVGAPTAERPRRRGDFTEAVVLSALSVSVVCIFPWYPPVSMALSIPLMAYIVPMVLPAFSGAFRDVVSVLRSGNPRKAKRVLSVEHIDRAMRPRLLYEFPDNIKLDHLVWISDRLGEGVSYSRRNLVRSGKLSQKQYEDITMVLLRMGLATKRNAGPTSPIDIMPDGERLFSDARALVVGGGWLASPQKGGKPVEEMTGEWVDFLRS